MGDRKRERETNQHVHLLKAMRKRAFHLGREVAERSNQLWPSCFDDSLSADVLRFEVLRQLRVEFPKTSSLERDTAIREML